MRIINTVNKVVSVADIDPKKHIIVAKLDGYVCLGQYEFAKNDTFRFHTLNDQFTLGNYYLKHLKGKASTVIAKFLEEGAEVEAFDTYQEAFKWILENE
jgi:hypothetical protein